MASQNRRRAWFRSPAAVNLPTRPSTAKASPSMNQAARREHLEHHRVGRQDGGPQHCGEVGEQGEGRDQGQGAHHDVAVERHGGLHLLRLPQPDPHLAPRNPRQDQREAQKQPGVLGAGGGQPGAFGGHPPLHDEQPIERDVHPVGQGGDREHGPTAFLAEQPPADRESGQRGPARRASGLRCRPRPASRTSSAPFEQPEGRRDQPAGAHHQGGPDARPEQHRAQGRPGRPRPGPPHPGPGRSGRWSPSARSRRSRTGS